MTPKGSKMNSKGSKINQKDSEEEEVFVPEFRHVDVESQIGNSRVRRMETLHENKPKYKWLILILFIMLWSLITLFLAWTMMKCARRNAFNEK